MAINKIAAPLSTGPNVFAAPVIAQLAALLTDCNHGDRCNNANILQGALFNIGGTMFKADSDTAINGAFLTTSRSIKFTVSGNLAVPSYSDVVPTWNGAQQGYYDTDGNYYYLGLTGYGSIYGSYLTNFDTTYKAGNDAYIERQGQYNITISGSGSTTVDHIYVKLFKNGVEYISEQDFGHEGSYTKSDVSIQSGDVFTVYAKTSGIIAYTSATATITPIL